MDSFVTLADDDSHRVHAAEGRYRRVRKKFHRDTRLARTPLIDRRPPSFPRLFIRHISVLFVRTTAVYRDLLQGCHKFLILKFYNFSLTCRKIS